MCVFVFYHPLLVLLASCYLLLGLWFWFLFLFCVRILLLFTISLLVRRLPPSLPLFAWLGFATVPYHTIPPVRPFYPWMGVWERYVLIHLLAYSAPLPPFLPRIRTSASVLAANALRSSILCFYLLCSTRLCLFSLCSFFFLSSFRMLNLINLMCCPLPLFAL
jgi:hypothetical protein